MGSLSFWMKFAGVCLLGYGLAFAYITLVQSSTDFNPYFALHSLLAIALGLLLLAYEYHLLQPLPVSSDKRAKPHPRRKARVR